MHEIGKKIKTLRQSKGWSQGEVAKALGISVPAFSKIETEITDVNLSRLDQIAKIFDVSLVEILSPSSVRRIDSNDELIKAKEAIEINSAKIIHLQEYIITLYEELYNIKKNSITNN